MHSFLKKFSLYFAVCRGYSIPISLMSCLVPFIYSLFNNGNILNGIISILGVVILHLATNLFDDIIDYINEKKQIDKGLKKDFNFQAQKCLLIRNGTFTLKQVIVLDAILFIFPVILGTYFTLTLGVKILYVLLPSAIICLLYPILGCLGLGEILVALIFSPLIYSGIYFVMTSDFSPQIFIFSISTGLLAVAVLHNHMLLDYKFDTTNRKITLSRLCGNEYKALYLLILIIIFAYLNIIICFLLNKLTYIYLLPLLSIPYAITLIKIMKIHIYNPNKEIKRNIFMSSDKTLNKFPLKQRNFMMKFLLAQNLLYSFSIILCISIIIDNLVIK